MKHALFILAAASIFSAPALSSTVPAEDALARSKNCMACHAVDRRMVGPSFRDIAQRYAGNARAPELLAGKIIRGGSGVWGPIPMPPSPQVNEAEARRLAVWILATR